MTAFEIDDYGIYSYDRISPEEDQQIKTLYKELQEEMEG